MSTFGRTAEIKLYYSGITINADTKYQTTNTISGQDGNSWNLSTRTVTISNTVTHSNYLIFPFSITGLLETSPVNSIPSSRCYGYSQGTRYRINSNYSLPTGVTLTQYWEIGPTLWDAEYTNPRLSQAESPIYYTPWTNSYTTQLGNVEPSGTSNGGTIRSQFYKTGNDVIAASNDYLAFPQGGVSTSTQGAQYAGFNEAEDEIYIKVWLQATGGTGTYSFDVTVNGEFYQQTPWTGADKILTWVGRRYVIDGIGGDEATISSTSTLAVDVELEHFAEASLTSACSLSVDADNFVPATANLSSIASITITPLFKFDIDETLSTQCELLATTNNFTFATASISSAFSQSQTPTLITDITKTLSSATTQTASAGMIFDIAGDYTWDSLTDTWNDWPFDTWVRPYTVISAFDVNETLLFKPSATLTLTGIFDLDENVAFNEPAEADLSAIFSISPTAQGIIDQGSDITSNFSTTALANAVYDAIADFDGVLSAELIANLIIGSLLATPSSQFSLASSPTFKPGGEVDMSAAFEILDKLGNMIYDADASLSAFYSELAVGSIYQTADFYNTFKILQETRNILIAIENRQHIISEEKRLNTIKAESRNLLVPQETRRFKLKVAPVTNRFTTPKVRSPR